MGPELKALLEQLLISFLLILMGLYLKNAAKRISVNNIFKLYLKRIQLHHLSREISITLLAWQ